MLAARSTQPEVRGSNHFRLEFRREFRPPACAVNRHVRLHVALSGSHGQIAEERVRSATGDLSRKMIAAGIDQPPPGEKVQVLEVFSGSLERGVYVFEVESPRQRSAACQARTARALGEGEAVGIAAAGRGKRIGGDFKCSLPAVQLARTLDTQRRRGPRPFRVLRGNRTLELQVTTRIVEDDVRAAYRQTSDERQVALRTLVRVGPLPIRMASGVAHEMEGGGVHFQSLNAERMPEARYLEIQSNFFDLRRNPRGRPRRVAYGHAFGSHAGMARKEVSLQGAVNLNFSPRMRRQKADEWAAKIARIERRGKRCNHHDHSGQCHRRRYQYASDERPALHWDSTMMRSKHCERLWQEANSIVGARLWLLLHNRAGAVRVFPFRALLVGIDVGELGPE